MTQASRNNRNKKIHPALKPACVAVLTAWCGLTVLPAHALDAGALPTNGQITAGSGSIGQSGTTMTVTQTSDRMAATWNTFNIGANATVNFVQPTSSSVALNRVTSGDASQILGQLNANGQVYLINPSGILFGAGSSVNVGGLVASTLNISDANFMAGKNAFDLEGATGSVINQGNITAADGGYVALLGAQVRNEGNIIARLGRVVLAAGEKMTLDFNGDGLINVEVNNATLNANVLNSGLLQADGGAVIMTARATDAMLSNVVNNSGVIEARSLRNRNGSILLDGGTGDNSGVVANSGTLNVSGLGSGETGGSAKVLGQYVGLFDGTRIDASGDAGGGTVLVGGNYQGNGTEHQSDAVFMGGDATIKADAVHSGNGGTVVLWSTGSTRFHGDISAQAGGATGRGGTVETSGHDLQASGLVHVGAVSGQGGDWLIDPYNLNITSAASVNMTASSPFTSSGAANSTLSSATLNASLSEGANVVVLTAAGSPTNGGDINVLDDVKAVGNSSLTLQAHRSINMSNHVISNATGKLLNVSLIANFGNTGNGSIALSGSTISTNGGNLTTSSNTINVSGSTIDAGGGNINMVANQANVSVATDAFVVTGGSRIVTNGSGSIVVDGTTLGSGNGTRIFSTNNTIAATGSGNLTVSGNASSGFGVLVCSTAATSSQTLTVGSGNLTVKANSGGFAGASRGVYLAASGTGSVTLNATAGGAININGSSTGSYGTVLNSTGASSLINLSSSGNINLTGNTSGGTTPALALIASGNGSSSAAGAQVNVTSTAGNITMTGNNTVINNSSGSFKALSIDVGGQYAAVNVKTTTGNISLNGTSASGRGVDIAPSALNAVVNIGATSGNVAINGNSTNSFGGYGIFFNSSGSAIGVSVTTVSGDITLRGDSVGTSDAIALGGNGTASVNNISSQGGNITLNGNFHSPNVPELDHGIAILGVTNKIQTTGSGNVTLIGNAADQGDGVSFYSSGNALVSVENGALNVTGSSVYGDGVSILTGTNSLRATGSGSVTVTGMSTNAGGITIYPSTNASSTSISTNTGKLTLDGTSGSASGSAGITIRSPSSGAAAGVNISSNSGAIALNGTAKGGGDGIAFVGSSTNGFNTLSTGGSAGMTLNVSSNGAAGIRFTGGTNSLKVVDGVLLVNVNAPNGSPIVQSGDATTFAASGSGVVIYNFGRGISNLLTNAATAPVTAALQTDQVANAWNRPSGNSNVFSPFNESVRRLTIDVATAGQASEPAGNSSSSNSSTQGNDNAQ
ncbi:filamentous hemagglutinin N-terminal domain-containing protein [Herbaspirillum lusitanum]|uniref:beta strand repeat-containing protein n=1 Tax=Herbaspirillum lusitanum TaxID=213312 RepID=UPI0022383FE9|nr:filamentous hemagglutinin N-terminal domain-containing protein [Herbaspirillum lusitanum]MCW5297473.1 filamentous hemagglutinin N-terminal domain-containing protein [Herbaspirillum lusitanum]